MAEITPSCFRPIHISVYRVGWRPGPAHVPSVIILAAAVAGVLLLIGWVFVGRAGWIEGLLVALFVAFNIGLVSLVVWFSARWLNRAEVKREQVERTLESAHAERLQRATMIQSVLEGIGDGVIVVDPGGKRIYNLAAKRILGIDLTGLAVSEWNQKLLVFRPDQKTPVPPDEFPTARASRGETVDDLEVFVRHAGAPNGIFISAAARPLRNELGESQGVVAIFRDLTARRQAEETQRQLAAIVQSTDDAMFSLDVDGLVTGWNAGAER